MRIVRRAQLCELPEGTVFCPCVPQIAEGLFIFGGRSPGPTPPGCLDDFLETGLLCCLDARSSDHASELWDKMEAGESVTTNPGEDYGREGSFDPDQRYLVYELDDVQKLIAALQGAEADLLSARVKEQLGIKVT